MWVDRTPEETKKWHEATAHEARSHGRLIAGCAWFLVTLVFAGGWFFSYRTGVATQQVPSASFWVRLPVIALISFPFAWFIFRRETRNELAKLKRRTVCPKCDTSGEAEEGTNCSCGGVFVSASSVKWVED
jgi:hypothetical protein